MSKANAENLIVIVGKDDDRYQTLTQLLEDKWYKCVILKTVPALEKYLSENQCLVVLIDIDTVPVENKTIKGLTLKYTDDTFMCMSDTRYHPELKDTICYHVYACIKKSIDPDELFYFLRSIRNDNC